jgi:nucleotide-binding universal stress UspA family protein
MALALLMTDHEAPLGGRMAVSGFTKLLVPVDFSACSEEAFRVALTLSRSFQAEVLLMHVIDTNAMANFTRLGLLAVPSDSQGQKRRLRHYARLNMRRLLEPNVIKGVTLTRILSEGRPFIEIAKTARIERVDLVVMGSYGESIGDVDKIFFGSTAEKVVRTVGCSVLTVPLSPKPKR